MRCSRIPSTIASFGFVCEMTYLALFRLLRLRFNLEAETLTSDSPFQW